MTAALAICVVGSVLVAFAAIGLYAATSRP
jgi:hypothetical protein